jgi:DNA-binding response OmpR family regulator
MSGARILVVDDEPEITRALSSVLFAHGFESFVSASATASRTPDQGA